MAEANPRPGYGIAANHSFLFSSSFVLHRGSHRADVYRHRREAFSRKKSRFLATRDGFPSPYFPLLAYEGPAPDRILDGRTDGLHRRFRNIRAVRVERIPSAFRMKYGCARHAARHGAGFCARAETPHPFTTGNSFRQTLRIRPHDKINTGGERLEVLLGGIRDEGVYGFRRRAHTRAFFSLTIVPGFRTLMDRLPAAGGRSSRSTNRRSTWNGKSSSV